ncbi:MAG: PAS domain-containing protein [Acidobacteriota bacterium]
MLLILLHTFWITGHLAFAGLPLTESSRGIIDNIELGYFSTGFIVGGLLLLIHRFKNIDLTAQQQLRWVGYGILAGVVPFSLAYVLPTLAGIRANFAMESSMLFLAFIPLSIGYAVIHFRLMDVENIARQSVAYFVASSLLLALYLLFVIVLGQTAKWIAPQADFVAICIAVLIIALLFAPLRNAIQNRLDRRFYKDSYKDRSGLLDFARKLSSEINLETLSQSVAERVSKTFHIEKIAIFLADPVHRGFFRLTYGRDSASHSISDLLRNEDLFDPDNADESFLPGCSHGRLQRTHPSLTHFGFYHMLDLKLRGRRIGAIALGRPAGRRKHYSSEDLELLTTLAGYAAMALENANLYRSIENKAVELERLKAYTENIIESINIAVIALNSSGQITSCNRAFEKLYAANRQQIIGTRIENLLPGDVVTSIKKLGGSENWDIQTTGNMVKLYLQNKAGKHLFVNLSFIPLLGTGEMTAGSLVILDDITEKAELEKQLLQSEKLSSIGLLAAGIAHEINTPIAGISSYTQMLLKNLPPSDKRKTTVC